MHSRITQKAAPNTYPNKQFGCKKPLRVAKIKMNKKSHLVLASSSKYRQQLLTKLGIPFECYNPNINEERIKNEPIERYVQRLSVEKATIVGRHYPSHLIIGSDQAAISCNGDLLTKPYTAVEAELQLSKLSGKTTVFYTGLALLNSATNRLQTAIDVTTVTFKELSPAQISSYIRKDNPIDCAGSFKCESLGISLFKAIEGRDPNALIGLPLIALTELLENEGIDPLTW